MQDPDRHSSHKVNSISLQFPPTLVHSCSCLLLGIKESVAANLYQLQAALRRILSACLGERSNNSLVKGKLQVSDHLTFSIMLTPVDVEVSLKELPLSKFLCGLDPLKKILLGQSEIGSGAESHIRACALR